MAPSTVSQNSNRFVVSGISITSLRRLWKPALPKKKQEPTFVVVITAKSGSVTFAITGAAIDVPAMTNGTFTAEVPFLMFKRLLHEPFEDGALIEFEFSPGSFSVAGITTKSPQILVQSVRVKSSLAPPYRTAQSNAPLKSADASPFLADTAPPGRITNPLDTPMGLPLLGAYKPVLFTSRMMHWLDDGADGR